MVDRKVGGRHDAPTTVVTFEVEYRTDSIRQAKQWARRHSLLIFREDEVEAVTTGPSEDQTPISDRADESPGHERVLPITNAYLRDPE